MKATVPYIEQKFVLPVILTKCNLCHSRIALAVRNKNTQLFDLLSYNLVLIFFVGHQIEIVAHTSYKILYCHISLGFCCKNTQNRGIMCIFVPNITIL